MKEDGTHEVAGFGLRGEMVLLSGSRVGHKHGVIFPRSCVLSGHSLTQENPTLTT